MRRELSYVLSALAVGAVAGALAVAALAPGTLNAPASTARQPPTPAAVHASLARTPAAGPSEESGPDTGAPTPEVVRVDPVLARVDELAASWTRVDDEIARLKLESMSVECDNLTEEQARYLASWDQGT